MVNHKMCAESESLFLLLDNKQYKYILWVLYHKKCESFTKLCFIFQQFCGSLQRAKSKHVLINIIVVRSFVACTPANVASLLVEKRKKSNSSLRVPWVFWDPKLNFLKSVYTQNKCVFEKFF
jgi:hypothetical protein